MRHSNAVWVFFGTNPLKRPLHGRPEHTDALEHDGTWHLQLRGAKVWTLRPTAELIKRAPSLRGVGRVRVRCDAGDVLCLNTRLWWHSTHIPGGCDLSLSVARDMYFHGSDSTGRCDMTNIDGHYATRAIARNEVVFAAADAPDLALPRSRSANCAVRDLDGALVVVAKRKIASGEWFSVSDSEEE